MRKIIILFLPLLIIACGGGSSGSTTEPRSESVDFNGLYLSPEAVMLVDIDGTGDVFASDSDGNIFAFDKTTTSDNELLLTGVTITGSDGVYYDAEQTVTVSFDGNAASAMTSIDGISFVHTFKRQPDTAKIADLAGTYTNTDTGETWSIDAAGNFTVNGLCTLSGTLTNTQSFYHTVAATATSCIDPDFNGSYQGMVFSITIDGISHLAGVIFNKNYYMWGDVPL